MAREKLSGKVPYGVDLPPDVIDEWDAACRAGGFKKWQAVTAAFRLFRCAPPELKTAATGGDQAVLGWFERAQRSMAMVTALEHMKEAERLQQAQPGKPSKAGGGKAG